MQLVAYGAQDVYLTGNPQITFFKVVYRRHTNFACEAIEQTFNGTPAFGGKATVPITRNGDLVTKMWLKTTVATTDTLTSVTTGATTSAYYVLGTAGTAISGATATLANLSFAVTAAGTFSVTADAGTEITAALFPVGRVVRIQDTTNYNGYYTVETAGNNTVVILNALSATFSAAGTPANEATDTNAKITPYAAAETFTWATDLGYAMINSVELQIGGTKIDKHYGRWMHIWSQLTRSSGHNNSHTQMITAAAGSTSSSLYVPLQFFCCRNDGLALPLIALQYHDVRLEFDFSAANQCCTSATHSGNVSMSNTTLLTNYIYLDSEERKRFAQASHEYLIEQLQFTGVETVTAGSNNKVRLNFNHPVKELVWGVEQSWSNFTTAAVANTTNSTSDALLQLNGHDRFSKESGTFFNYVQPHTHHSRTPSAGINVYSFALNPEDHQPSGTCNFSRIDNATLSVTTASGSGTSMYVYGTNYNVLRVMSGMGGVAYSN